MNASATPARKARQVCDQCGLPMSLSRGTSGPHYCCLGCELAASLHGNQETSVARASVALRLALAIFFSMNVMVFTLVLWSWDTYAISEHAHASLYRDLLRYACACFSAPVLAILGGPLFARAVTDVGLRRVTSDVLLATGVAAAAVFSLTSLVIGADHVYFEVVCMLLVATTLGRWLEAEGKQRALNSIASLRNRLPELARRVTDEGVEMVPVQSIEVGETLRVLPGEQIPLDGIVIRGSSFVDQRMINGESDAMRVDAGEPVFGGSMNQDGAIELAVEATVDTGMIQRIIDAVREAAQQNCPEQKLADRIAHWFVPTVALLSIIIFTYHLQLTDLKNSFMTSMSVLLIACPCALGIATPMAIWIALNRAAAQGIVFRSGRAFTALAKLTTVGIDKTGTLTGGNLQLDQHWTADSSSNAFAVARAIAAETQHPLAGALLGHLSQVDLSTAVPVTVTSSTTIPGRGVSAEIQWGESTEKSRVVRAILGSARCCEEHGFQLPAQELRTVADRSSVFVAWDGKIQAGFYFTESLRPEALIAITRLQRLGLNVLLLTGDDSERANSIAGTLGIESHAGLLPHQKQQMVAELQADHASVAMIGDGLNDAPALTAADVGIALGSGVELSREAADACIMSSNLELVPWAIELARSTVWAIKVNLFWALAYNGVGIAIAASGRLNPIVAAVAMVGSSTLVIIQSLRIPSPSLANVDVGGEPQAFATATTDLETRFNLSPTDRTQPLAANPDVAETLSTNVSQKVEIGTTNKVTPASPKERVV